MNRHSRIEIVKPSFEIMRLHNPDQIDKHVEKIARICYKSEDKINDSSSYKMIKMLDEAGHHAMFEHGTISLIMNLDEPLFELLNNERVNWIKFTNIIKDKRIKALITTNLRVLNDIFNKTNDEEIKSKIYSLVPNFFRHKMNGLKYYDQEFNSIKIIKPDNLMQLYPDLIDKHVYVSIKFVHDRSFSHQLVRHRASFAQESQRYCNYTKGKFDNKIIFIDPEHIYMNDKNFKKVHARDKAYVEGVWYNHMVSSAEAYFRLVELGATPQIARKVLPNSAKTEIVMTCNIEQWKHVFKLRADENHADPSMFYLMKQVKESFIEIL